MRFPEATRGARSGALRPPGRRGRRERARLPSAHGPPVRPRHVPFPRFPVTEHPVMARVMDGMRFLEIRRRSRSSRPRGDHLGPEPVRRPDVRRGRGRRGRPEDPRPYKTGGAAGASAGTGERAGTGREAALCQPRGRRRPCRPATAGPASAARASGRLRLIPRFPDGLWPPPRRGAPNPRWRGRQVALPLVRNVFPRPVPRIASPRDGDSVPSGVVVCLRERGLRAPLGARDAQRPGLPGPPRGVVGTPAQWPRRQPESPGLLGPAAPATAASGSPASAAITCLPETPEAPPGGATSSLTFVSRTPLGCRPNTHAREVRVPLMSALLHSSKSPSRLH